GAQISRRNGEPPAPASGRRSPSFAEPTPGRGPGSDCGSVPTVTSDTPESDESSLKMELEDIPVVILCGGMGTRLREASEKLPKPMVDIGGRPILWHIMKTYGHYGF